MRFSLIPREEKFFVEFNQHAALIVESARAFRELSENWAQREEKVALISKLEHEADTIVHTIIHRLNKTFVTPLDREDIHALASGLDDVVDFIQGSAVRMQLFKIPEPTPQCMELARILEKSCEVLKRGVEMLPTFHDISPLREEIHQFEKQGDRVYRQCLADLFEAGNDPLHVIKWKDIYEIIETAIDKCEDVFDVLDGVVLKHA